LGSRDVIGHVTIRLAVVDFLSVTHCDHASIWHRYGDMAVWSSSRKALPETEVGRRSVRRSVLNITLISYILLPYVRNVARKEYKITSNRPILSAFWQQSKCNCADFSFLCYFDSLTAFSVFFSLDGFW